MCSTRAYNVVETAQFSRSHIVFAIFHRSQRHHATSATLDQYLLPPPPPPPLHPPTGSGGADAMVTPIFLPLSSAPLKNDGADAAAVASSYVSTASPPSTPGLYSLILYGHCKRSGHNVRKGFHSCEDIYKFSVKCEVKFENPLHTQFVNT